VAVASFSSDSIDLRISDNGIGFDPSVQPTEGHYGLQGIRERVHRFGGNVRIESKINCGTDLRVSVPRAKLCVWLRQFAKCLKSMVARDGVEPPTPAFSE
jgi:nitrate/nitrite-specific signal transduction histidine kinase